MKLKFVSPAVLGLALLLPSVVLAVPINLFNSGVDSAGTPLSGGSIDPHFSVLETGNAAVVMSYIPQNYLPNSASSMWIWENASGFASNVIRTFRMRFDLSGFDHTTAIINGLWGTDDFGAGININGQNTGNMLLQTTSYFTGLHAFQVASGFQAGINTLDFIIMDNGSFDLSSGFRVELTGNAEYSVSVPEAATLVLLLIGLAAFGRRPVSCVLT